MTANEPRAHRPAEPPVTSGGDLSLSTPSTSAAPRPTASRAGSRPGLAAWACALGAFAAAIAAVITPWLVTKEASGAEPGPAMPDGAGVVNGQQYVDQVADMLTIAYYPGWLVLFTLLALALAGPVSIRRTAVVAGIGWCAGLLLLVVAITRKASEIADTYGASYSSWGPGVFLGCTALILSVGALVLAGLRAAKADGQR